MKKLLLSGIALLQGLLIFAQCEDGRYRDLIFSDVEVTSGVNYGQNYNLNGSMQTLALDVYEPEGDNEESRPLIIFAHGGSFVGGSRTGTDVVPLCQDFAKMGYVVASITYRLGIPLTLNLQQPATEAVVRGYHDMKAAIRFFRKDVAENGNTYDIDPDQIYLAGVSAGGFITLHVAYMDEEDEIPDYLDLTEQGLTGGLEGDSGNPGYSSEVSGIINIAGAIKDTAWIHTGDEPVCNFHGTSDTTVPFDQDMLVLFGAFDVLVVNGSNPIDIRAEEVGLTHCFEIYELQGHVPHVNNVQYYDTTRSVMSNFLSHLVCENIELDCAYRELNIITNASSLSRSSLSLFPNPSASSLQVEFLPEQIGLPYEVYNAFGQKLLADRIEDVVTTLSVASWPAGMYTVIVKGHYPATISFLKE